LRFKIQVLRDESGGFTLETAIIMPIVFIINLLLLFLGLLLCEQSAAQSCAQQAAEKGAFMWSSYSCPGSNDLYRRMLEKHSEEKKEAVREYAQSLLHDRAILKPYSSEVFIDHLSSLFDSRLVVRVVSFYRIPFLRSMGLLQSDIIIVDAASEAVIDEPVELIRNTDFLIESEQELEKAFPEFGDLREELIGKVKDVIGSLIPGG
jgi:hypothetical protein